VKINIAILRFVFRYHCSGFYLTLMMWRLTGLFLIVRIKHL